MDTGKVEIVVNDIHLPYKRLYRDICLSVNEKEVRVYVEIMVDEFGEAEDTEFEISETDSAELTAREISAVNAWCGRTDLLHVEA